MKSQNNHNHFSYQKPQYTMRVHRTAIYIDLNSKQNDISCFKFIQVVNRDILQRMV